MSQLTNANVLQVSIIENVYWKELGLLVFVWIVFLALQISKVNFFFALSSSTFTYVSIEHTCSCSNIIDTFHVLLWKQQNMANCSVAYWVINLLQVWSQLHFFSSSRDPHIVLIDAYDFLRSCRFRLQLVYQAMRL